MVILASYIVKFFMLAVVRELDVPGEIVDRRVYPFEFQAVEMPYESYYGVHVKLRYELTT